MCIVQATKLVAVVIVQTLSRVRLFATPRAAARQPSLPFTTSRSLLRLMSTESVMPSNHLVLCYPLLLLPSGFRSIAGCLTLNPTEHFISLFHWGGESILQTSVQTSI